MSRKQQEKIDFWTIEDKQDLVGAWKDFWTTVKKIKETKDAKELEKELFDLVEISIALAKHVQICEEE